MFWLNFFRSNKDTKSVAIRSHLDNLIQMAKVDGYYDEVEKDYLLKVAQNYNIPARNIEEVEKYSHEVSMAEPENKEMIYRQLYELVGMILADGVVHNQEIELCARFAEEMGVAQGNGMVFISNLVKEIEKGATPKDIAKFFS
ncbi:MAG: hypothetical protein RMJ97_02200 [Raineya sp.]|nr:TerB family tellurite resistance protein [Raineya sp.]MDW8295671.1 hypothetical protein [Raineya sp.]